MPIAYKLTDQKRQTYEGFQWELNKPVETSGDGKLCSAGWLHFYEHPLLAVLHNPIHAYITNPRLFKAKVSGKCLKDKQLKAGYTKAVLVEELPLPQITVIQKTAYAILCAKQVYKNRDWNRWADNWLNNKDRSTGAAAGAAADAAGAAAHAAYAAAHAADAAADAADAAAHAAAHTARAAGAAADAADAAAHAADAAAHAAADAADAADAAAHAAADAAAEKNFNLIKLAKKAMEY